MANKVYVETGTKTFEAENDLSAKQYYLVELGTSAGQVDVPDANTDIPIGVLRNDPKAQENASVRLLNSQGTEFMVASAAIAKGALVVPALIATAANKGKIRTLTGIATETVYIVGMALEAATADGDIIEVALMPAIQRVIA